MYTDRTTKGLLALIAFLLAAHLLKDLADPAYAKVAKEKIVIAKVERPVEVKIVGIYHRTGAKWDNLYIEMPDEQD